MVTTGCILWPSRTPKEAQPHITLLQGPRRSSTFRERGAASKYLAARIRGRTEPLTPKHGTFIHQIHSANKRPHFVNFSLSQESSTSGTTPPRMKQQAGSHWKATQDGAQLIRFMSAWHGGTRSCLFQRRLRASKRVSICLRVLLPFPSSHSEVVVSDSLLRNTRATVGRARTCMDSVNISSGQTIGGG